MADRCQGCSNHLTKLPLTINEVATHDGLKIDVFSYPDILLARQEIKQETSSTYQNRFPVAGAKETIDGSPQGFTAWCDRPHFDPVVDSLPGYFGYPAASAQEVADAIDWAFANDILFLTHANGEAASDQLIAFIRDSIRKHGGGDRRPLLIHGQFLREDQIDAFKDIGVLPFLFSMHRYYWGDWHREHTVGPRSADDFSPTGWCVKYGMKFTTHHDALLAFPDSICVLEATVM